MDPIPTFTEAVRRVRKAYSKGHVNGPEFVKWQLTRVWHPSDFEKDVELRESWFTNTARLLPCQ